MLWGGGSGHGGGDSLIFIDEKSEKKDAHLR